MKTPYQIRTALITALILCLTFGGTAAFVLSLQETRTVGVISITADTFTNLGGGLTRAEGHIRLGDAFYLTGPSDVVIFDAATVSGNGSLAFGSGSSQVPIFTGAFSAPASTGITAPDPGSSYDLRVAGFAIDAAQTYFTVYLPGSRVSGVSVLRITPPGVNALADVDFTLTLDTSHKPVFEGMLPLLEFSASGVSLQAVGATLSNAGIDAATALLTLPEGLGGLSIAVQSLHVAPDGLGMGDGLAFALPNILFGDGSRLKITGNHGLLTFAEVANEYRLSIDGTMDINLPENVQSVQVNVTLEEEDGQPMLSGSLDHLSLTVAQTTLALEQLVINTRGLFIDMATLTLPPVLGGGQAFVYNVSVTSDGLAIGAVGAQFPIPDIVIGDGQELAVRNGLATLVVMDGAYRFDISASLAISLPENHLTTDVAVSIADGEVSGRLATFELTVAGATLAMTDVVINNSGLAVDLATLSLPNALGGASAFIADVSVTDAGLVFGAAGVEFDLPDIVFPGGQMYAERAPGLAALVEAPAAAPLSITNNRAILGILENGSGYRFAINGTLRIDLPNNAQTRTFSFAMAYDPTNGFFLQGHLSGLSLTVAGATLALGDLTLNNTGLYVVTATLTLPAALGGATATVSDIAITGAGLSISGGTFDLPLLKLADGKVLINGHADLIVRNGQYQLNATGALQLLLPENTQTVALTFALDSAGHLSGTLSALTLNLAGTTLALGQITLSDAGLATVSATLTMPALLGGASASVTDVRITRDGLTFGAAGLAVALPDAVFGNSLAFIHNAAQLSIVNTPGITPTTQYQLSVQSQMALALPDNTQTQAIAFTMIYTPGGFALAGTVSGFDLAVAGASLTLRDIRIAADGLHIANSTLILPSGLGGNTLMLTNVSITGAGLSLGAADLSFPDIEFGNTQMMARAARAAGLSAPLPAAVNGTSLALRNNHAQLIIQDGHYRFGVSGEYVMGLPGGTVRGALSFSISRAVDGGYRLEGTLPYLSLTNMAGAALEITNMALNNDGFFVAAASLTLPSSLGVTSVTVADVSITAAGLKIGNGTFKLPDIVFPNGNGSRLKIANPTANLQIVGDKYVLSCSGTLMLRLPDNSMDIALNFSLADGQLSATVTQLNLTIAGTTVTMNGARLDNTGLHVTAATLTLPARFGSGVATLNDVAITEDGLRIGRGAFALPEIKIGDGTKLSIVAINASLAVMGTHYTLAAGGTLHINLPGNVQDIGLTFSLADGNLSGVISQMQLTLAGATLKLQQVQLSNTGLAVNVAILTLPEILGGATTTLSEISITGSGLSVSGGSLTLNDIKIGDGSILRITRPTATLTKTAAGYIFDVRGRLLMNIPQNSLALDVQVMVDESGQLRGQIPQATLTVAQVQLMLKNVAISATGLSVPTATLQLPSVMGGGTGIVYDVRVDRVNGLQIGGGGARFPFPPFKIGNTFGFSVSGVVATFELAADHTYKLTLVGMVAVNISGSSASVSGTLTLDSQGALNGQVNAFALTVAGLSLQVQDVRVVGWRLEAALASLTVPQEWGGLSAAVYNVIIEPGYLRIGGGEFQLPTIKAGGFTIGASGRLAQRPNGYEIEGRGVFGVPGLSGGCAIGMGMSLYVNTAGVTVLEITPPAEGGGELAAPARLAPDGMQLRYVRLGMYGCTLPIGATGFGLTRVEGEVTLAAGSTHINVGITIASTALQLPILGPALSGDLDMTFNTNPVEYEMVGALKVFVYKAAEGQMTINARDGFRTTLWIDAVVARGTFSMHAWNADQKFHFTGSGMAEIGIPKGKIFNFWVAIPPEDWWFSNTSVEFGEFYNGSATLYGIKGRVAMEGYDVSVFVDENARLRIGNTDAYRLVDAAQLRRYLAAPARMAEQGVALSPAGDVLVSIPVTRSTDLIFALARSGALPGFSLLTPDSVEITPGALPANVRFVQTALVTGTQQMYVVDMAQAGVWQVKLSGDPAPGDDYQLAVLGAAPPPALSEVSATATGATTAQARWRLNSSVNTTTVSIYITPGPITYTAVITQAGGTTTTVTLPLYTGSPAAEGIASPVDGTPQTYALNLAGLTSGVYWVWLEASDGRNPPVRTYAPAPVVVQQAPPAGSWNAGIVVTPTYRALNLAWARHASPDADGYVLYIGDAPGKAKPSAATQVITTETATSAWVAGLTPGRTYYAAVKVYDNDAGWTILSAEAAAALPVAEFSLQTPAPLTAAGGTHQTFIVTLTTALAAYPDTVGVAVGALPDGLDVSLTGGPVTPTVVGVTFSGVFTVADSLAAGTYVAPILAQGGGTQHQGELRVTVLEPRFALAAAPGSVTMQAGEARAVVITANRTNGESDPVYLRLEGAPVGLLWTLDRDTLLPGQSATLRVTDTVLLPHGDYTLALSGEDGEHVEPLALPLHVLKSGFGVEVEGPSMPVMAGTSATVPITVTATGGWTAPVTVRLDSATLPALLTYTLALVPPQTAVLPPYQTQLVVVPPAQLYLTLLPDAYLPAGIYILQLTAEGDGQQQSATFRLEVVDSPTYKLYLPIVNR